MTFKPIRYRVALWSVVGIYNMPFQSYTIRRLGEATLLLLNYISTAAAALLLVQLDE